MNGSRGTRATVALLCAGAAIAGPLTSNSAAGAAGRAGPRVISATEVAAHFDAAGGTAACAVARRGGSSYPLGLRLVNGCAAAGGDVAIARYTFTLPTGPAAGTITLQAIGTTTSVPSELSAAFHNGDGTLELPGHVKITGPAHVWRTIASIPAAGHVDSAGRVHADVLLDATYGGVNDFDLDRVRLLVTVPG